MEDEMTDLVKRLREILENATPGPWAACKDNPDDGPEDVVMAGDRYIASCHEGLRERAASNAALIAFAPDIAAELIEKTAHIEVLEAEVARLRDAVIRLNQDLDERRDSLTAMTANAEALAEAVSLTCRADELREKYHKLPNDHNRIGEKRSKKSHARDAWLRAFRKAAKYSRSAIAAHAKLMGRK